MRPGAQVADAESAAGERVHDGAVAGAVVGQQLLDFDPVAAVEGDGAAQEAGSGGCLLVVEDLGVGEAAVVVDGDMNELPAGDAGAAPVDPRLCLRGAAAADAVADAADAAELLDVDVDQLAGPLALVADRLLEPDSPQPADPEPRQDPGDGRERHLQRLGDLRSGHPQPAQLDDDGNPLLLGAVRDTTRRRRAIKETGFAGHPVSSNPLPSTADANPSRGRPP